MCSAQHHLGVNDQVDGEEEGSQRGIHNRESLAGENGGEQSQDEKHHQTHEENAVQGGEVVLGLECERSQRKTNDSAYSRGHENLTRLVRGTHTAQQQALAHREHAQEDEVVRSATTHLREAGEHYDTSERGNERHDQEPGVGRQELARAIGEKTGRS